ncbi:MAG: UDP-N-acetylmuramate dehydrogenase [Deltaproteobacteria bacterium]|nr:UDP-N-acetylmuramate dehydrogenase [Deltaproteobacteria bacterium]
METAEAINELTAATGLVVTPKEGSKLTTYSIGGMLAKLVEVNSTDELLSLVRFITETGENFRILGAGSNLLLPDAGLDQWVIKLGKGFRQVEKLRGGSFRVMGAMPLIVLSHQLSAAGYSGLEFAGGIPASFGGAIYMNAGAHGGEIVDLVKSITVVTVDGELLELPQAELNFTYRKSNLPKSSMVVSAEIELIPGSSDQILQTRAYYLSERKKNQPITLPSSGSVFKNPKERGSAGRIIESLGLKGVSVGGAQISEHHANWIVNKDRLATANEVLELVRLCQDRALTERGVRLETELIYWG